MSQAVFFDLLKHILVTAFLAAWLFCKYKDIRLVIASFLTGFLIDLDHLFDYFYWAGLRFSLKEFFDPATYVVPTNKAFVLLHGWEFLPILFLLGMKLEKKVPGLKYALTLPYLLHLIIDQIPHLNSPLAYFFAYRLINNFSLSAFNGH